MSKVGGEKITAYNLRKQLRERPMVVTAIYRYDPAKEGGKSRYRLAGHDKEHTDDSMSVFCSEDKANAASRDLSIDIERAVAKPRKSKKSCKEIGEGAEERCEVRRKKASPKKAAPKAKAKAKRKGRAKKVE